MLFLGLSILPSSVALTTRLNDNAAELERVRPKERAAAAAGRRSATLLKSAAAVRSAPRAAAAARACSPAPRSLALEANAVKSVAVADIIFALESTRRVGLRLRAASEGASGSERDFKADSVHVYPRRARETGRHRAARKEGGKVR